MLQTFSESSSLRNVAEVSWIYCTTWCSRYFLNLVHYVM